VSNFSTSQKVIPANEVVARIEEIEGIDSEDDNMTPYVTELTPEDIFSSKSRRTTSHASFSNLFPLRVLNTT